MLTLEYIQYAVTHCDHIYRQYWKPSRIGRQLKMADWFGVLKETLPGTKLFKGKLEI